MEIRTVTIVGTGIMGSQIAQVIATGGFDVYMYDTSETQLNAAMDRIRNDRFGLAGSVQRGKITAEQMEEVLARIHPTRDLAQACANTDLVIEAVPEDIKLKIRVFRQLDELCPPGAILASNTAGLSVAALAAATDRPEQVLGWHWFQPCVVMKLAEIIAHDETSDDTIATIVAAAEQVGKNPVVVKDNQMDWGFVGNRINRAVRLEAARIVAEGLATEEQVDTIMRDGFRWPMGPFEMRKGMRSGS